MKTSRILLQIGGVANALFFLFHLWLGWSIWHWAKVPVGLRALLEIFNLGGTLFIGFFAYVSLCRTTELLETGLGRSVCWLVVLLFGTRAAAEFIIQPAVQPAIVATCVAAAGLYLAALLLPRAPARETPAVSRES